MDILTSVSLEVLSGPVQLVSLVLSGGGEERDKAMLTDAQKGLKGGYIVVHRLGRGK